MKKLLTTLLLLGGACALSAQTSSYPTAESLRGKQFYVEIGGPGSVFSANFDSRFRREATLGWGYRVGLGFDSKYELSYNSRTGYWEDRHRTFATIPLGINYVFGKTSSSHAFEAGAGITILTRAVARYDWDDDKQEGNVLGHFSFMYRRQPVDGGFTWRIGFTPIIGTGGDIIPSMAAGLGYSF